MSDVRDQLAESLHRHADPVTAPHGLAQAAHRRALRLRLRRRITAGVTCLAALAVVIPVGYNALGRPAETDISPIETPTTAATSAQDKAEKPPARITIDLDSLPRGEAPKVPWYSKGVIHDGDRELPIPGLSSDASVTFALAGSRFLVMDYPSHDSAAARARLKDADGKVISTLPLGSFAGNVVVSPDGRRLAWARPAPGHNGTTTLVVTNVSTGEESEADHPDLRYARPVAFLGGSVVFATEDDVTRLWDPETGKISTIEGLGRTADIHGQVLLATVPSGQGRLCPGLADHTRGDRTLWASCGSDLIRISADGRYVFGESPTTSAIVFDAADGRVLLEASDEVWIDNWAVEPGGDVLFSVHADRNTRQALVRCALNGRCELATAIVRTSDSRTALVLPRSRG